MASEEKRLASLDAVRGIAALSVAIPHFFLFQDYKSDVLEFISIVAVEVFFVLSGVVLAPQLMRCVRSGSLSDVRVFYLRRWMRTLPPYIIVLAGMAIVADNVATAEFFRYLFFVRNFVSVSDAGDFFMPAWSLAVEEWFYFIFPVFLVALTRANVRPVAAAMVFLATFLVAKIVASALFPELFANARRIVVLRVDAICFGFLLSFAIGAIADPKRRIAPWAAVACALSLALAYAAAQLHQVMLFVYAAAIFAATLIALSARIEGAFRIHPLVTRITSFLATTSYMVYLVHVLLIIVLARTLDQVAIPARFAIYLVALLSFCWLFYLFVESPILKARPKYRETPGV